MTDRITAFNPGQSPPPVNIPMFIVGVSPVKLLPRLSVASGQYSPITVHVQAGHGCITAPRLTKNPLNSIDGIVHSLCRAE